MNEHTYRSIVSGTAEGLGPSAMRALLRTASVPYSIGIRLRNRLYDWKMLPIHSAAAVVVSIGNLTTGGTGKTPLVIWLTNALIQKGICCAVLTRGYKTRRGAISDEPALLARACGGAAVVVDADRAIGARKAIEKHQARVLILDDGFQHRRLKRDLDILAIDATCPFGFGKMLPAGLLREPIRSIRRADAAVITRFDQAGEEQVARIEEQIRTIRPRMEIFRAVHRHTEARTIKALPKKAEELSGKKVFVFCGIGNPGAFLQSVESLGCIPAGNEFFNDHHPYAPEDLERIFYQAKKSGAQMILTTEKDWVKAALLAPEKSEIPLLYLTMELEFLTRPDTIIEQIEQRVRLRFGKQPQ